MTDKLPSQREAPLDKAGLFRPSWYRYFFNNDLPTLNATLSSLQTTVETQAAQISQLQSAISTIRDVAVAASVPSAEEIPDLGR